jgi:hypothetical protein
MNLEIIEKIKRMITTSNELKGLGMNPEQLVNLRENVTSQMLDDINDAMDFGDEAMV